MSRRPQIFSGRPHCGGIKANKSAGRKVGWLALGALCCIGGAAGASESRHARSSEAGFPIVIQRPATVPEENFFTGSARWDGDRRRSATAHAEQSGIQAWWNGPYLVNGDGTFVPDFRSAVKDRGFTLSGNYQGAFFGVVDSQRGTRGFWNQQLNLSALFDPAKGFGIDSLEGLTAFVGARYRDSWRESDPNDFVLADPMFNPSNWQSGTQFRLLYFGLEWQSGKLLPVQNAIGLKLGWLQPQASFIDQPLSKLFLNNAVNSAKGIGGNIAFSSSFSTWGGVLTLQPRQWLYLRQALYMSFPTATATGNHGLAFEGFAPNPSRNGLLYLGEAGITPTLGASKLPGKFAFGGYYYGSPGSREASG